MPSDIQGLTSFQLSSSPSRLDGEGLFHTFEDYVADTYGTWSAAWVPSWDRLRQRMGPVRGSKDSLKLIWRRLGNRRTNVDLIYCSGSTVSEKLIILL